MHKPRDAVTSQMPCYAAISKLACWEVDAWQGIRDVTVSRGLFTATAPYANGIHNRQGEAHLDFL